MSESDSSGIGCMEVIIAVVMWLTLVGRLDNITRSIDELRKALPATTQPVAVEKENK